MLGTLRKNWFQWILALHMLYDLSIFIWCSIILGFFLARDSPPQPVYVFPVGLTYWGLSTLNSMFLLSYGLMYNNTIVGSFWFQLAVRTFFVTLSIVAMSAQFRFPNPFYITGGGLHFVTSAILLGLFLVAWLRGDKTLGRWCVDVEDLATGVGRPLQRCTWEGTPRYSHKKLGGAGALQSFRNFLYNAILRRVHPVETKLNALCLHVFALAAVTLLLTRTITLLTQLAGEKLPSRTLVESCRDWPGGGFYPGAERMSIIARYPGERGLNKDMKPDGENQAYQLSIVAVNQTTDSQFGVCNKVFKQTDPDSLNRTDWYWVYSCQNGAFWQPPAGSGFRYTLEVPSENSGPGQSEMPDIWLTLGGWEDNLNPFTPYVAPSFQLIRNMYTEVKTIPAQRKFVSSSALWDAISGSKPKYKTINLYLPSLLFSRSLESASTATSTVLASGFIHWPIFLGSSLYTARSEIEEDPLGPRNLCQVVEEYRVGNTFDVLASIGGLLALLQGIHMFLFGRPLFWGLFGAKLITPFGFVGRFATKGFRQRLHDHYYISDLENRLNGDESKNHAYNNLRMTHFLLDYVLDIGPVALPGEVTKETDSGSSDDYEQATAVHLDEVGKTLITTPPNPRATEQRTATRPFLPEIEISGL